MSIYSTSLIRSIMYPQHFQLHKTVKDPYMIRVQGIYSMICKYPQVFCFCRYEEWEVIVGDQKQVQLLSRLEEDGEVNNMLLTITALTIN